MLGLAEFALIMFLVSWSLVLFLFLSTELDVTGMCVAIWLSLFLIFSIIYCLRSLLVCCFTKE